jgi:hypothetical protein
MESSIRSSSTNSERSPLLLVVVLAGTAALTAGGLWLGYRRGVAARPVATSVERPASTEMEQRLVVMEARLRSLERRRAADQVVVAADPGAAPVPAPALPVPPADEADVRRYFAALDERLAGERRDPSWAPSAEQTLWQSAEGLGEKAQVEAVRCGEQTCRVTVKCDPGPPGQEGLRELLRREMGVLPEAVIQQADDRSSATVYLAREGREGFPPMIGSGAEGAP